MTSAVIPNRVADLLDGLDPEQADAVRAPRGPVCVLAGAGTGKTRTITHRIAYLVRSGHVAPNQVLAVTFTTRAAGQLRTRLRELGVEGAQARTFHSAALRQLRYFWPRVVGGRPWEMVDGNKLGVVAQVAQRLDLSTQREVLRDLAGEIEWAKASLLVPDDYPEAAGRLHRNPPVAPERVAELYRSYEELKNDRGLLDFDDLLLQTTAVLEQYSSVAEEFQNQYRCFVVDEYQDITPAQQRLLEAWLGKRDDLTVVGDPNQTIYSFGGATPRPLLDFSRRFPGAPVVRLERDYRSSPQVVELANRAISMARDRPAGARSALVGQRPEGPRPEFTEYADEPAEAAAVAERIRELTSMGVSESEIAVLFRVNAQSESYERALSEAGIPYLVRGGERFFSRSEIRQAVTALRQTAPETRSGELVSVVRDVLRTVGLTDQPPPAGAARERWDGLLALVTLAEELVAVAPGTTLADYLRELDERAGACHPPTVEGVTLASLHAAKGLEWDAVFLVGLTEGTLPIQHAGDGAAVEEERRLFYVGLTRPRTHLWLSWALSRSPGGRANRRRSRFLSGLLPEDHPATRPARPQPKSSRSTVGCRRCAAPLHGTMEIKLGRCQRCPDDVDQDLLARLKEWRTRRAQELSVPAFVVFTDATLLAIAEQRPTDDQGLLSISGIGTTKLERFGPDVLDLVRSALE